MHNNNNAKKILTNWASQDGDVCNGRVCADSVKNVDFLKIEVERTERIEEVEGLQANCRQSRKSDYGY